MVNLKSSVYIFLRSLESSLIFRKLIFYLVSKFFSLLQGKSIRLEKCTKHMFKASKAVQLLTYTFVLFDRESLSPCHHWA